jgi:hypothetical protein
MCIPTDNVEVTIDEGEKCKSTNIQHLLQFNCFESQGKEAKKRKKVAQCTLAVKTLATLRFALNSNSNNYLQFAKYL